MEPSATVVLGLIVGFLTVGLNLVIFIWSGAWGLSNKLVQMEERMLARVEANRVSSAIDLEHHQMQLIRVERESLQKIHDLETWARDAFVSNNLFTETFRRFEKLLDRIDRKIDHLQGRSPEPSPTES